MANAKIGSQAGWNGNLVESITANKQLVPGDSGKLFICDQNSTADVLVNLPQVSTKIAGWHATFILSTNSSNDFLIMGYGLPAAGGTTADNDLINHREFATDGNSTTPGNAGDGIQFSNAGSEVGIKIELVTDGSVWFAYSFAKADADITIVDS